MKGIYAAVATPLHEDLRIHHEELARHCNDLLGRGCAGIALFGTTGEGPSFSLKERLEALEILTQSVHPGQIILANGSSGIQDTVQLCRAAINHGCCAVLLSPPSYFKNIREEGTVSYYREILQRVSRLPVLLYHYPKLTGVPITMSVIAALRGEFPEMVVGLKESEGDLAFTKEILAQFPGFHVFVGKELQIAEAVRSGGAGAICGLANLYPELIRDFYENPTPTHVKKLESISQKFRVVPFNAAVKCALETQRGSPWRAVSPPLVFLETAERQAFLRDLELFGYKALA